MIAIKENLHILSWFEGFEGILAELTVIQVISEMI